MMKCARLSAVALGVAFGVVSGLTMMIFALAAWNGGYGTQLVDMWATVYPGFGASLKGSFIGAAWGFVEGFIFGIVTGWIYNLCLCCCSKSSSGCGCGKASCSCCGDKRENM